MSEAKDKRMMNLTLHIQSDKAVKVVEDAFKLELERSPQGVYVGKGAEGLQKAASEAFERIEKDKFAHILIGGGTGMVALLVKTLLENNITVSMYEFENVKRDRNNRAQNQDSTFEPASIRKVLDT